ncbi:MAG: CZB domain-containing protein [Burkholderiaceae bacterium]
MQTAIIQHLEWCVLFNEHLSAGSSDNMPLMPLPNAHDSGLGQWLAKQQRGPAGDDPRLQQLTEEHARFHALAGRAHTLALEGRMDLASTLLNTDFERSRARVLELLRTMQKS